MDPRPFLVVVAVVWGALAVGFALGANTLQAAVAALAALVSLSLFAWYTVNDGSAGS